MPRGHWPAGKRRHATDPDACAAAMAALRQTLALRQCRGAVSTRALAAHLSVSDRTVRRWLAGVDLPPVATLRRIGAWVRRIERGGRG